MKISMMMMIPMTSRTPEQRFWSKVNKTKTCWLWIGARSRKGYGELTFKSKWMRAHRLSWLMHFGPIPSSIHVCHRCDNPSCVNPDHLFLGTAQQNVLDCHEKDRHAKFNGSKSGMAKMTEDIVLSLRKRVADGATYTDLGHELGLNRTTISRAVNAVTWHHI